MPSTKRVFLLLLVAVGVGLALRVWGAAEKRAITFVEALTYLAATGHQGEYQLTIPGSYSRADWPGRYPAGDWAQAKDWKHFVQIDQPFCFQQTRLDLLRYDLHPPLYFWLLHLWSLPLGVQAWSGPSLNILLFILTAAALFGLARAVFGNTTEALAVVAFFALSPAFINVTLHARQYDLLMLLVVLLVWQFVRAGDRGGRFRWWDYLSLALITTAGILTQYHFAMAVAGGGLFLLARLRRANRARLAWSMISLAAGSISVFLIHPGFIQASFTFQRAQSQGFSLWGQKERLIMTAGAFIRLFTDAAPGTILLLLSALLALLTIGGAIVFYRRSRMALSADDPFRYRSFAVLYFLTWLLGLNLLLFITFLTPIESAMRPRHLALVWPFLAFVPFLIFRLVEHRRLALSAALCLAMVALALLFTPRIVRRDNGERPPAAVETASCILVDNAQRGKLLPVAWHFPDSVRIFAAPRAELLASPQLWQGKLDGAVYLSIPQYGNTPEQGEQLLALIGQHYTVTPLPNGGWHGGKAYRLEAVSSAGRYKGTAK